MISLTPVDWCPASALPYILKLLEHGCRLNTCSRWAEGNVRLRRNCIICLDNRITGFWKRKTHIIHRHPIVQIRQPLKHRPSDIVDTQAVASHAKVTNSFDVRCLPWSQSANFNLCDSYKCPPPTSGRSYWFPCGPSEKKQQSWLLTHDLWPATREPIGEKCLSWELLPSDVMAPGSELCENPSPVAPLATRSSALFMRLEMGWGEKQNMEKAESRFKTFSDHKELLLNLPWSGEHRDTAVFFKELDLKAWLEINGDSLEGCWRSHSLQGDWWINVVPMVHFAIVRTDQPHCKWYCLMISWTAILLTWNHGSCHPTLRHPNTTLLTCAKMEISHTFEDTSISILTKVITKAYFDFKLTNLLYLQTVSALLQKRSYFILKISTQWWAVIHLMKPIAYTCQAVYF